MKKHFKSLKSQLFVIFAAFVLISSLSAVFTAYYYKQKTEIEKTTQAFVEVENLLLKAFKEQENFFNFETLNEDFFIQGESSFIAEYNLLYEQIVSQLQKLKGSKQLKVENENNIAQLKKSLIRFDSLFSKTVDAIQYRGFKNQGLEGKMRHLIHQLEQAKYIPIQEVLSLRRHEKDYILRQDSAYIKKHKKLVEKNLKRLNSIPQTEALDKELELLKNYSTLFQELADYEQKIGLKTNSALKGALNREVFEIQKLVEKSKKNALIHQSALNERLQFSLITFWVLFLFFGLLFCYQLANKLSKRITSLSRHINYFVNTNFTARMTMPQQKREDEVGLLWNNILRMETEIINYLELFKEKVDEKTIEIQLQKEKLEKQKILLQQKKEESEQQNKDLVDGIKYASRIQEALLPNSATFQKQIEKGFVYFAPKDIVSGDIYYTKRLKTRKGKESVFSVIDCTGHGVPGAFMSVLATQAIDHAMVNKKRKEMAELLQDANNYIYTALKYYNNRFEEHTKDGMELAIGKLNRSIMQFQYAGANRPIYLVRHKKKRILNTENVQFKLLEEGDYYLYELQTNKFTLGTLNSIKSRGIQQFEIMVEEGDMIYMSTDGYADQFGGSKGKKLMAKKLKSFLISISSLEEETQKQLLKEYFLKWKGRNEQVDDVCLMGVRV